MRLDEFDAELKNTVATKTSDACRCECCTHDRHAEFMAGMGLKLSALARAVKDKLTTDELYFYGLYSSVRQVFDDNN